ncbi:MAG: 16S rRNA (uracil(1498)-N(3))-methyltransferase [Candidatus Izemoplasma sp.]|nr:16S rRNA (uracil(1498)-N(3))-methyltransferase [Candidatus Izemoplasma sp.]
MQQYFIDSMNRKMNTGTITGSDVHHIKHVMRLDVKDKIIVCHEGVCYDSTITDMNDDTVHVSIGKKRLNTELGVTVDIAQALIKKDNFELMLQKTSELGANSIIPLNTAHSIVKLSDKKLPNKLSRWNKITKEACEQSKRSHITEVTPPTTIEDIDLHNYNYVFVLYAKEDNTMFTYDPLKVTGNILVMVGPEGGFTQEEITYLNQFDNTEVISLGKRILRSETAPLFVLSVIGYFDALGDQS